MPQSGTLRLECVGRGAAESDIKIGRLLTTDEGIRGGTICAAKPRDGTGSPPTGLSRLLRSFEPRMSRRASGYQRYDCTLTAPSGSTTPTTIPMAHCCARWRIHRKPPSWLRPRQEVTYSLPSWLNVRHCGRPVKSSIDFLLGLQIPSGSAFPQSMSAHTAVRATSGRMMHTSVIRYGTTKPLYCHVVLAWPHELRRYLQRMVGSHPASEQLGGEDEPSPERR